MNVINKVNQSVVFSHWEKVEKISIFQRIDIVLPLLAYADTEWNLAEIEGKDINNL